MYAKGHGVVQNFKQATTWLRKAAEQGHDVAQSNLCVLYANGQGVAQDDKLAYVWCSVAAANGNEAAAKNRDILAESLTPAALAKAQDLASKYFKQYQSKS